MLIVAMTKVQVTYRFHASVDAAQLDRLDAAHSTLGLFALQLSPAGDALEVTYDASRLQLADVDHALHSAGLAVVREAQ